MEDQLRELQAENVRLRGLIETGVVDERVRTLQQETYALREALEAMRRQPPSTSFKCPLPTFSGDHDVESWFTRVELAAEAMGLGADTLARASYLTALRGSALTYIESHPEAQRSWEVQKNLLRTHFLDETKSITLRGKLRNLHMVGNNIEGFYREFMQLVSQITPPLSKEEVFDKFFFGLPPAVRERVLQHKALTLEPALEVARRYYSEAVAAGQPIPSTTPMELDRLRRQGHSRGGRHPPLAPPVSRESGGEFACYRCGEKGHKKSECPRRHDNKESHKPQGKDQDKRKGFGIKPQGNGKGSSPAGHATHPRK